MPTTQNPQRPTRSLIDLDTLAYNFRTTKEFVGANVKYLAVVKADAYGHGAIECARRLETEGIDWFGVAIPEEGLELRREGVKTPILCLGSFWPGQEELLVENQLTPVVFSIDAARRLNDYAESHGLRTDVHVKIDTGMGRVGIDHADSAAFAASLGEFKGLEVTGLLTHFAAADDPAENDYTNLQIQRFEGVCEIFRSAGHDPGIFDLANSPGAIAHSNSRSDMVRLGGALYGLLDDILPRSIEQPVLKPVLSLRSQISQLRSVRAGESLGYGRTFVTKRDSLIASVSIGYADGYPRSLSNKGAAVINGQRVPVVGRISMDWTLFDVTDVPNVAEGDEVFLIGGVENGVTAADIAGLTGTIGYEITCGISPRVPRIFIESASDGG